MSDSAVTAAPDRRREPLKVGMLIIGSLIWDSCDARRKWRAKRLNVTSRTPVSVPIRYGRKSESRGDSYTMVFSPNLEQDLYGRAIVVPCRREVSGIDDLIEEAEWLWAAERNSSRCDCVSGGWGCVSVVEDDANRLPEELRDDWKNHVSDRKGYGEMHGPGEESSPVDHDGFLTIPWPLRGTELHLDALLATATKPNTKYPEPLEVAKAWSVGKGKRYIEYFLNNCAHGITTCQDGDIEDHLKSLWE